MPLPKLLVLTNQAGLPVIAEWRELLDGFSVTLVAGIAAVGAAVTSDRFDCALVTGPTLGCDPAGVLEEIHCQSPELPVVFYDPELTAAEAVRLVRSGAFHCLGYRDSLDSLRQSLEHAAEEKRCQEKAHCNPGTVAGLSGGGKPRHADGHQYHSPDRPATLHGADHGRIGYGKRNGGPGPAHG